MASAKPITTFSPPRTQGGPKFTGPSADQLPHAQGGYKRQVTDQIGLTSIKWYNIHTQQTKMVMDTSRCFDSLVTFISKCPEQLWIPDETV